MSVTVKSNAPGELTAARLRRSDDGASVVVNDYVRVSRADFLAAVEAECGVRIVPADAIVIERAELPEVTANGPGNFAFSTGAGMSTWGGKTASEARAEACELLALAEYLDAHPPVPPVSDEDVETLAGLLRDDPTWSMRSVQNLARRLLATGRVSVTHE